MNALDQAFIKAFAKDRTSSASETAPSTRRVTIQSPEQGVESAPLVLHGLYQQGRRLRIDRPNTDVVSLAAHMVLPTVEHVESYQPEDVQNTTALHVFFEDRLTPLDELKTPPSALMHETASAASKPIQSAIAEPKLADEQSETEPNVTARTDALEDMEVPALARSEGDVSKPSAPAAALPAEEADEVSVEDPLLVQCQPQVLLAASELNAPKLMTREYGLLEPHDVPQLDASLTAAEVSLADVDPTWWGDPTGSVPQSDQSDYLNGQPDGAPSTDRLPTTTQMWGEDAGETPVAGRPVVGMAKQTGVQPCDEQPCDEQPSEPEPSEHVSGQQQPSAAEPSLSASQHGPCAHRPHIFGGDQREQPKSEHFPSAPGGPAAPDDAVVGDDVCGDVCGSQTDGAGSSVEAAVIDETPGADLATGPAPRPAFTPAWEVDAFRWPGLCLQLDEQTSGKLTQSGEELFVATGDGLKVLLVTSSVRHEGRTTLALSLARTAALAGSRVALVDADSGNPELARSLGLEAPCDWQAVLSQQQSLEEAAVASADDHVTLFPLTCPRDDFSGAADQMLTHTLNELSRYFDLVVVDLPPFQSPAGMDPPADTICPIDMAVVVRHVQITPRDETLATVSALRKLGVRAVGIIENFAPRASAEVNE